MPNTGAPPPPSHGRPLMACDQVAMSATVRVNRPTVSRDQENGFRPGVGSAPYDGLNPTTPQYDAGRITEPPVCVPTASGTRPAATAAAEPADDPPGVRPAAFGLSVRVGFRKANSVVVVLPTTTPPARRIACTMAASLRGWWPA